MLTGLDDETTGIDAVHQGAQDYLIKGNVDGRWLACAPMLDAGAHFVARKGKGQAWLQGVFPDVCVDAKRHLSARFRPKVLTKF